MFGYIRPAYRELKVKEFEAYKACYCGLCRTLGKKFGNASKFILNYDFVFLVMLLWDCTEPVHFEQGRCAVHPCRKRMYCRTNMALEKSAAMSVILAWWKIQDDIKDSGFFKSLAYKAAALLLKKAYKTASNLLPEFDKNVREKIWQLSQLEQAGEESIDKTADCFAQILACISTMEDTEENRRAMEQTLYHIGRYIYIIDACDDVKKDSKSGSYNPVAARFAEDGELSQENIQILQTTLLHSRNLAGTAFELLPYNPWSETVRNVICYGMPEVCRRVLSGTFHSTKDIKV